MNSLLEYAQIVGGFGLMWATGTYSVLRLRPYPRLDGRAWRHFMGMSLLPLATAAFYAWQGPDILHVPARVLALLLALPSLVGFGLRAGDFLDMLRARTLHRTPNGGYYLTSRGVHADDDLIEGCAVASFRVIGGGYARDRSRVYWADVVVEDADLESFDLLELPGSTLEIGRDRRHFYLGDEPLSQLRLDDTTWTPRSGSKEALARSNGRTYLLLAGCDLLEVPGADASLRLLEPANAQDPQRGDPGVDRHGYLADAQRVYHFAWTDEGEDFYRLRPIAADPKTFRWRGLPEPPWWKVGWLRGREYDAEDAHQRFLRGEVVS